LLLCQDIILLHVVGVMGMDMDMAEGEGGK
jgi:hypothetical protein